MCMNVKHEDTKESALRSSVTIAKTIHIDFELIHQHSR